VQARTDNKLVPAAPGRFRRHRRNSPHRSQEPIILTCTDVTTQLHSFPHRNSHRLVWSRCTYSRACRHFDSSLFAARLGMCRFLFYSEHEAGVLWLISELNHTLPKQGGRAVAPKSDRRQDINLSFLFFSLRHCFSVPASAISFFQLCTKQSQCCCSRRASWLGMCDFEVRHEPCVSRQR
jgi:hypothetical protein